MSSPAASSSAQKRKQEPSTTTAPSSSGQKRKQLPSTTAASSSSGQKPKQLPSTTAASSSSHNPKQLPSTTAPFSSGQNPKQQPSTAAPSSSDQNPKQLPSATAPYPKQQPWMALDPKFRKYIQHEPVVRCGVPDPQKLNSIRGYWSTRRTEVIDSFYPLGQSGATPTHMLKNKSQAFIRRLLKIEFDLAEEGYCFSKITPSTFAVDEYTGVPLVSSSAVQDIVRMRPGDKEAMVGENMKVLADMIDDDVIGTDNAMPEEVEKGLLKMMREEGYRRRYVIVNHVSLVPIENRLDLNLRMFQHLYDTIAKLSKADRDKVQKDLLFPADWHGLVKKNRHLVKIYYGKTRYRNRGKQAWMVHRFNRNAAEHGLENSVNVVHKKWEYTRPDLARMLYSIFPLFLHSVMRGLDRLGMIREIEIESLFAYREA